MALLNLSSWCLVMVEQLFLAVPRGCLQFMIVVFTDHTHLLFLKASESHCEAILQMDEPHDTIELMRFNGMINYLGKYIQTCQD